MPKAIRQHRFRRPPGATELFLVRHGESEPSVLGQPFPVVDGHGDPALAPEGAEQAERVGERLAAEGVDAIYVTTLRRTHQTAAPLARRIGVEPVVEPDLREVFLGDWENTFRHHVADGHPIAARMYAEERWDVIPNAEPAADFSARIRGAVERIVARHPDGRVVVVTHGGVIGDLVRQAVQSPRGFAFVGADNASITHLVVHGDRWVVRRFNDTAHLPGGLDLDPAPSLPED
jgi:probable phosphoglycerate mutase